MTKEIKYKGYTTVPSDYECEDGTFAAMLNLVPDNGSLKPVQPPTVILQLEKGIRVAFVHKTANYTHYIVYDERSSEESSAPNALYWIDSSVTSFTAGGTSATNYLGTYNILYSINAVGNTLLLLTANGVVYHLWKDSKYKLLGDHLPDLSISFGLQGHPMFFVKSDEDDTKIFKYTFTHDIVNDGQEIDEAEQTKFTNAIIGKINKLIREEATEKGRFAMPFFVRYALRLYDGSVIKHSAPILMTPCSNANEIVYCDHLDYKGSGDDGSYIQYSIMIMACDIDYYVVKDAYNEYANLDDWSDIVKSVDIFVSAPLYVYNQAGTFKNFETTSNGKIYDNKTNGGQTLFLGRIVDTPSYTTKFNREEVVTAGVSDYYMTWEWAMIRASYYNDFKYKTLYSYNNKYLILPKWENDDAEKNDISHAIINNSNFYLLKKINIDDLKIGERTVIDIEDDYLQSLTSRETMSDDYLSHERLIAKYSHAYNSRINLAGISRILFRGFSAESMRPYIDAGIKEWINTEASFTNTLKLYDSSNTKKIHLTTILDINDATQYVTCKGTLPIFSNIYEAGYMYSYPNMNATTMWEWNDADTYRMKMELEKHNFLNLAYFLRPYTKHYDWKISDWTGYLPSDTSESLPIVADNNKLYTSEVNNPFLFKASGINSVGSGRIIGISSANKALSQGQFGQFPLYAFTTDGIWALEVSSTGSYSAKQPFSRDVCISSESITQLDSSILFATDRGIMLVQGSETVCLTDVLSGENIYAISSLPKIDKLAAINDFAVDDISPIPFLDYIKSCRMIYDYVHQRILLYNPSCNYVYIYSIEEKQWGMMQQTIASHVNSYPDAQAMLSDGSFVNFSKYADEDYKQIALTRPMKLDMPDVLKTVSCVIQRGYFRKGHVKCVLLASRDLFNWFIVWTSGNHILNGFIGTPYKYFRILLLSELSDDENISGCSVKYDARMTNKLR